MPAFAGTLTVGVAAANATMPTNGGMTRLTNTHATAVVWVNIAGGGTASVEGDNCVPIPPNWGSIIVPGGNTYSMISTAASTKVVAESALGRI